ncbi:MAG: noncanonical pyrimidine nucleotidase, YjjG family, partial [Tissierellia bacterium]|nr:noncanonical pyrimidine nucleotidase, YjjG family [Tissierellia bacterium]
MNYEVLIFDADDTLFDFRKSEEYAIKNTMIDFNIEYKREKHLNMYRNINDALWKKYEKGNITQKKLKIERFKIFSEKLNITFDEDEFAKVYMKYLASSSFLYKESMPLIKDLHKDYKLLIITNGLSDVQNNRIRKSPIGKYFEDIIISEEVGFQKPNPEIFEYALRRFNGIDKNKFLMIGDSLTSDIKGGINFGIDTC